jgi:hypothetical protein
MCILDSGTLQLCAYRKKKAVHKTTSTDDKRLQNTLKRLGVNTIPSIEEVNIFMDTEVIHFSNPKGVTCCLPNNPEFWMRMQRGTSYGIAIAGLLVVQTAHVLLLSQCKPR